MHELKLAPRPQNVRLRGAGRGWREKLQLVPGKPAKGGSAIFKVGLPNNCASSFPSDGVVLGDT